MGDVVVNYHCGRVQFRRKTIKESAIQLPNVFGKTRVKKAFTDATKVVRLSCNQDGILIEPIIGTGNGENIYANLSRQANTISFGVVSNVYCSSIDFRNEMHKLAEWPKYFYPFEATAANGNVEFVRTFLIVTKDVECHLFIVQENRAGLQDSIRKMLKTVNESRALAPNHKNSITAIRYLSMRNLDDPALLCPFNNAGEWMAEVSQCRANGDFSKAYGCFNGFELLARPNETWSNHLSQYFIVPKLYPSTVWVYSHRNGSMLLLAHTSAKTQLSAEQCFNLDYLLSDANVVCDVFYNLSQRIAEDHYKDWLASSSIFWGGEGEWPAKWLSLVSEVLRIVSMVNNAIVTRDYSPVILMASHRSTCLMVAALCQLCLSAESRSSIKAVNRLIQKNFVSLGFAFRLENKNAILGQSAVVIPNYMFTLFLDCFHQLLCQNPMEFAVSKQYLSELASAFVTEYYYEFSFSSPASRIDACRRDKGLYRWFFPIQKLFSKDEIRQFVNPLYCPPRLKQSILPHPKSAIPIEPISYFPFDISRKSSSSNGNNNGSGQMYARSQSESNLSDAGEDFRASRTSVTQPRESIMSRLSRLAPPNFFRQRSAQTLIIYKPLTLSKVLRENFPSPAEYFSNNQRSKRKSIVHGSIILMPRFLQPCLKFWSDFLLAHEYDFDQFDSVGSFADTMV